MPAKKRIRPGKNRIRPPKVVIPDGYLTLIREHTYDVLAAAVPNAEAVVIALESASAWCREGNTVRPGWRGKTALLRELLTRARSLRTEIKQLAAHVERTEKAASELAARRNVSLEELEATGVFSPEVLEMARILRADHRGRG